MTSRSDLSTISHETDWQGRQVTVMGLGSFGGGIAAVRFLVERGVKVLVSDRQDEAALADSLSRLANLSGVEFRLGGHDWSHFEAAELVVVNPALPPDDPIVERIAQAGIPTSSEMELFWQLNRARVIGVTGSNGKSTTAALTHHVLQAAMAADPDQNGRAWLGGNIGRSLLPHVDEIQPDDWVVLELSSFQLKALNRIQARPNVAIVTNFAPNHLDWHGTLEDYRESKQALLRWQTGEDDCVLTADDEVATWPGEARRILTDETAMQIGNARLKFKMPPMKLRGRHNHRNATSAFAAVFAATATDNRGPVTQGNLRVLPPVATESFFTEAFSTFEPLPHRLAAIATAAGRTFYDDSIATTPESAIAALNSFDEPIVLLAGGSDKKLDLTEFAESIATRAKAVALLGATGPKLDELISARNPDLIRFQADSLQAAFDWVVEQSSPGDVVLLSPGCASLDWFRNFKDRGEQFSKLAADWCEHEANGS